MNDSIHKVSVKDLDSDIIEKARKFAKMVVEETFDRFSYSSERRMEVIFIGKISEEVFVKFAKEKMNTPLTVNYDIYPGTHNVDSNDFIINDIDIDIKSSKDTKNVGILECYGYFNFPVPTDQTIKDITLSIIYDFNVENFYLVSWIDKETYKKNYIIKSLPVGEGKYKEFYLCPLTKGRSIKELKSYLEEIKK